MKDSDCHNRKIVTKEQEKSRFEEVHNNEKYDSILRAGL